MKLSRFWWEKTQRSVESSSSICHENCSQTRWNRAFSSLCIWRKNWRKGGKRGPLPRSEILWVPGSRVEGKWAGERKKITKNSKNKKSQKKFERWVKILGRRKKKRFIFGLGEKWKVAWKPHYNAVAYTPKYSISGENEKYLENRIIMRSRIPLNPAFYDFI